ncbi:MAG TPA: ATP-binding protein [Devosiaceae bacterium]|nr:ATP-binding protein [Devosiaceae bacterium]
MIRTAEKDKALIAWSSGKDSALALWAVKAEGRLEVVSLLTTVTSGYDRVSMHGVREELLDRQAAATGMPLCKVVIPPKSSNETYESRTAEALAGFIRGGVSAVVFGDIFLEDVRKYREDRLARAAMRGVFPIWQQDTSALARRFIEQGFKAVVTCVDTQQLDARFAGRQYDSPFLADLPEGVDPCGENGEFHTFVYAGPVFDGPLGISRGEVVMREDRFCYCDLVPDP